MMSQPVLVISLDVARLAEKHKYQFYSLWFAPIGARTHNLEHAYNYTTDVVMI